VCEQPTQIAPGSAMAYEKNTFYFCFRFDYKIEGLLHPVAVMASSRTKGWKLYFTYILLLQVLHQLVSSRVNYCDPLIQMISSTDQIASVLVRATSRP